VRTVAIEGEGLDELVEAIDRHRDFGRESGAFARKRRERAAERVRDLVARKLERRVWLDGEGERRLDANLDDIVAGRLSPYAAAEEIVTDVGPNADRTVGRGRRERG
jgi:LAO/AO transport system kinase